MTITQLDPVRNAFAACSSGFGSSRYYETKGHAIHAFDNVLAKYGYMLDPADNSAWSGNEGHTTVPILTGQGDDAGRAYFSWFRMSSGRYEFVAYIT